MNINATLLGQIIFLFVFILPIIFYYLGKIKTQNPILTAITGLFCAFIPPVALIFLIVLILKDDVQKENSSHFVSKQNSES